VSFFSYLLYRVITIYLIIFYTISYVLENSDLKMNAKTCLAKFHTNKGSIIDCFILNET